MSSPLSINLLDINSQISKFHSKPQKALKSKVPPADSKELGDIVKEQSGILPTDECPVCFQGSHDGFLEDLNEWPQAAAMVPFACY